MVSCLLENSRKMRKLSKHTSNKGAASMSLQKNGASLTKTLAKALSFGAALLALTGSANALDAFDPHCCPELYRPAPRPDSCHYFLSNYSVYADFLYWQVNPEGLKYARKGGLSQGPDVEAVCGHIATASCEAEPGFKIGTVLDLGCCEWDFYAQYTWLGQCFSDSLSNPAETFEGLLIPGTEDLQPLIYNQGLGPDQDFPLTLAKGEWDSSFNVLDFGLGRTFVVNDCFDFRPHLGFKATWQKLKYNVRYEGLIVVEEETFLPVAVDIRNTTDFCGVGLRGGFDAAWRFAPCFSVAGGIAAAAVWSDACVDREDFYSINGGQATKNIDLHMNHCALIPVMELLLGLQFDTVWCNTDVFVFIGWENQVWINLNRFIFIENSGLEGNVGNNSYQFGPAGNVAYQGLTLRAGCGF
jgi:hypothetical protein